ncbi:MAG: putative porin [Bacteroidales bacterium]|jgi:hypothetical protein|nr:putative porin [Bacteroidales bacterium]
MFKLKLLYLIFAIGVCFTSNVFAQSNSDMSEVGRAGSTPANEGKTVEPKIDLYMLNAFGAFKDSVELDTILDYRHLYNPVFKDAVTVSYLGNYGLPYQNNDFFERETGIEFLFSKTREAYLLTPDKIKYYNTRTPYTVLDYSQSENKSRKNETRFNVLHTQNVSPYLNFTFRYDQAKSDGQYNNQNSKNNLVSIYSSYSKNKIQLHSGFIFNSIQNNENGGIVNDTLIFDKEEPSEYFNVNLRNTKSKLSNSYFFTTGEYRLGRFVDIEQDKLPDELDETQENVAQIFKPVIGFIYSFQYQKHYKEFVEDEDATNTFFENTYFPDGYIKDSIRFNKVSNVFQIKQYEDSTRKASFSKRIFAGQEFVNIEAPGAFGYSMNQKRFSNIYVGGGIFRQSGDFWTWNAEGKFYLIGRNMGQTELSGVISKPFTLFSDSLASISIRGDIQNRVADYFQEEFYSNHIFWKNDLKQEQNMTVRGSLNSPKHRLELGANYSLINNFIYYDTHGKPAQTSEELLIVSLFADKEFAYRNLHLRTKILYQKVSNQTYINVPEFSAFVSGYYKFIISKVLHTQIGADVRYNTLYYGDAYDPSTGLFHIQQETKIGNFPYIDAYASLKIKRTNVFFKIMNVGTRFLDGAYFTTPHYPMPRMTFRLGVAWAFYD